MEMQQKNLNMFFPCYLTPYSQRLPDVISTLKVCKGKTLQTFNVKQHEDVSYPT